ncbi:alpha/beta fold hydrolase [Streptosporangium pseudovulgare]|uniref:AB hydrolase-1 domain-containing protein n=1 Tax=Streptosporangium pseudovulgare TaxID=35765 RepID=A0ABQ2RDN9_9ACTN|nr:alpha/beta fold hydrolase [Streptosporangium pseudovulgare]GGQ25653.1 hypothetical protein GCM10010140_64880 [Streptosporangium pseudovulgare]
MKNVKTGILPVPGANLYYEVRGSGPVLLLICGGIYDAAGYAGLADRLADRYTVVTYDRRGNSRSPLDGPPEPQSIAVHADDAHRLLTAVGVTEDEPACVFGNSSGAVIGLELAARHPGRVRAMVAHEPPVFELLPDRDHWRAVARDVADAFREGGAGQAMGVFAAGMGMGGGDDHGEDAGHGDAGHEDAGHGDAGRGDGGAQAAPGADGEGAAGPGHGDAAPAPQGEPDPETAEIMARTAANMEFFIGYEVPPFSGHTPDLDALRASGVRVVTAVGETSEGEPPHRAALALAERLDGRPEVFPGDHGGFGAEAEAFAARLREVLAA